MPAPRLPPARRAACAVAGAVVHAGALVATTVGCTPACERPVLRVEQLAHPPRRAPCPVRLQPGHHPNPQGAGAAGPRLRRPAALQARGCSSSTGGSGGTRRWGDPRPVPLLQRGRAVLGPGHDSSPHVCVRAQSCARRQRCWNVWRAPRCSRRRHVRPAGAGARLWRSTRQPRARAGALAAAAPRAGAGSSMGWARVTFPCMRDDTALTLSGQWRLQGMYGAPAPGGVQPPGGGGQHGGPPAVGPRPAVYCLLHHCAHDVCLEVGMVGRRGCRWPGSLAASAPDSASFVGLMLQGGSMYGGAAAQGGGFGGGGGGGGGGGMYGGYGGGAVARDEAPAKIIPIKCVAAAIAMPPPRTHL